MGEQHASSGWAGPIGWVRSLVFALAVGLLAGSTAYAGGVAFGYDSLGRVISATYTNGVTLLYHYDAAGNRTALTPTGGDPIADDVSISTNQNAPITFDPRANSDDPSNFPLTVSAVTAPAHGTAQINGANTAVTYTPANGYAGPDGFDYTIDNGHGGNATAPVAIIVVGPPTAVAVTLSTNVNTPVTFDPRIGNTDPNNYALSISSPSTPSHGAVVNNGGTLTYTPATAYVGSDSFNYTISNGHGLSSTGPVSVSVIGPPTGNNVSVNTGVNTPVTITPTLADPNGYTPQISAIGPVGHGAAIISAGGTSITYTPAGDFVGQDGFTYSISDGHSPTGSATVSVSVYDAPIISDVVATTHANTAANIAPTITDPNHLTATITAVGAPAHGGASISNGASVIYTPTTGYVGFDFFSYTVSDGHAPSVTATIYVDVGAAPSVANASGTTLVNTAVSIAPTFSDPNGFAAAITSLSATSQGGTATISSGASSVSYTPPNGFVGVDSFTYTVSDGSASATATISISVTAPLAPTANNISTSTPVGVPVSITPTLTDPNGFTPLITSLGTVPHGLALISANKTSITYIPNDGYGGPDLFTYTVSDGHGPTASATISVAVLGAPNVADISVSTPANAAVTITPTITDPNGYATIISAVGVPSGGTTLGTPVINQPGASTITYTPPSGFVGFDSFTYTVSDTKAPTATATVTVDVLGPPVANNASASTNLNTAVSISPTISDLNGFAVTITSVTVPGHGTAVVNVGATSITYTPGSGFVGSDQFNYTISDGHGRSASANVTISVRGPPVASNASASTNVNMLVTISPTISDPNGFATTIVSVAGPTHGTAVVASGATSINYTPAAGYIGADSFSYGVSDGHGQTASATISVSVLGPPLANSVSASTNQNVPVTVSPTFSDANGFALTITAVSHPSHGSAAINTPGATTITYTPTSGFVGNDTFTYTVSDGHGQFAVSSINIAILGAPTANNILVATAVNTAVSVTPTLTDPNGLTPTIASLGTVGHGTAAISSDHTSITYTPTTGFSGSDGFTYTVSDGPRTATASVTATVADVPTAGASSATVAYGSSNDAIALNITGGAATSVAVSTQAGHGTATASGTSISYTPTAGYSGSDSFHYTATNATGVSAAATVTITVNPQAPVANAVSATVGQNTSADPITLNITGGAATAVTVSTAAAHGTATASGAAINYSPTSGYTGSDSFQYTATNAGGTSAAATVTITVSPRAPIANNVSAAINENSSDTPITLSITGGVATSVALYGTSKPANGSVTISGASMTYKPHNGYLGADSFQYTATNSFGTSAPATVSITVSVFDQTVLYTGNGGSWSYTIPAGVSFVDLEIWGAGGGGSGGINNSTAGYGAGGGGYSKIHVAVTPGATFSGTVGRGGSGAGRGNTHGGSGGATTATGSLIAGLTANGGGGGTTAVGAGGTASGGTNISGISGSGTTGGGAGNGGGNASASTAPNGGPGTIPGGGGAGDLANAPSAGDGADGAVTITARTN